MTSLDRARRALETVGSVTRAMSKRNPEVWKEFDKASTVRNTLTKDDREALWPTWSVMPMPLYENRNPLNVPKEQIRQLYPAFIGAASWRQTQGVYLVDRTLLEALWGTPITGNIPVELLSRLPEIAPMIVLPRGAFAAAGPDCECDAVIVQLTKLSKYVSLMLMLIHVDGATSCISIPLLDTLEASIQWTMDAVEKGGTVGYDLRESIQIEIDDLQARSDALHAEGESVQQKIDIMEKGGAAVELEPQTPEEAARANPLQRALTECHKEKSFAADPLSSGQNFALSVFRNCKADIAGVLSLMLYLCSEEPDVINRPPASQVVKTKKGLRIFPPNQPTFAQVGLRIGEALRQVERVERPEYAVQGTHASPRPHVRRAHWHTFLAGPRVGDRERRIKWIPAIPINTRWGDIAPVARPVEAGWKETQQ